MADETCKPVCSYVCWNSSSRFKVKNSLSVLYINLFSISIKSYVLASKLSLIKGEYSFVAATERWLKQDSDLVYELPGNKSISLYKSSGICGGIKCYYLDHTKV